MPSTNVGASSFVITTPDLQSVCSGSHGVPNGSSLMDPYRAELYGIFCIVCTLTHLVKHYNIQKGSLTIACDNKTSLHNAFSYDTRASIMMSSHDILWAIHDLCINLPISLIPQHVKGHQDQNYSPRPLSLLAKLNCYVDFQAGEYRKYIEQTPSYVYSQLHFYMNWNCSINSNIITSKIETSIKNHIYKKQIDNSKDILDKL